MVLIAIQDEGASRLYRYVQDAMVQVGATKPFTHGYRGSYALVGYTGPGRPLWIKQVQNRRRRGPSVIKMSLSRRPVTGMCAILLFTLVKMVCAKYMQNWTMGFRGCVCGLQGFRSCGLSNGLPPLRFESLYWIACCADVFFFSPSPTRRKK